MILPRVRHLLETAVLALLFAAAYRWPAPSGQGVVEVFAALLFPTLLLESVFRRRHPLWTLAALTGGLALILYWVPSTIAVKGNLPYPLALAFSALFFVYEAAGLWLTARFARWLRERSGPWGAALGAASGILLWEVFGFHVYLWSWGASFGAFPWLARSAAFFTSHGLSALVWGAGAFAADRLVVERRGQAMLATLAPLVCMLLAGALWFALPRDASRAVDVVMIQPNFPAGLRRPFMEETCWALTDPVLQRAGLPRDGRAALVLWPESSVMGRDDQWHEPRLQAEARRRGIAWLFGTEGGLLNIARGEVAGQPSFIQAKVEPMAFGERMPGPAPVRQWLDTQLGFHSQEPGDLGPDSSFRVPTSHGDLRVHPLICSEALRPGRVQAGLHAAGGDLLANLTNDGWFEHTIATDLHAAQIRLRACETGLPLLRATLTGKSGLFHADGSWELWGEPMTQKTYAFPLDWQPIRTPARSPIWTTTLTTLLLATTLIPLLRKRPA